MLPNEVLLDQVEADLRRRGDLPVEDRVLARSLVVAEPAYVVFTQESQVTVTEAQSWLQDQGISVVGRYGRWEYSSMGQVIRDGRTLALELSGQRTKPVEAR
jgi:protoporphyrinogen oxidase